MRRAVSAWENVTDKTLVDRVRANPVENGDAFEELVRRHRGRVAGRPDHAEDLAQEVFVEVYQGLARFRRQSRFSTWLHRVATNHSLDHRRSRRELACATLDDPANAIPVRLASEATAERDLALEEEHIVECEGEGWYAPSTVERIRVCQTLHHELDVNFPGLAVALRLLDTIHGRALTVQRCPQMGESELRHTI